MKGIITHWSMCDCTVWPMFGSAGGSCGRCGVRPEGSVTPPSTGRAMPRAEYHAERRAAKD